MWSLIRKKHHSPESPGHRATWTYPRDYEHPMTAGQGAEPYVALRVFATALAWSDEHLNRFVIRGREYGVAHIGSVGLADDPRQVRLADFELRVGERFLYEYDFTDSCEHDVRVELLLPFEP